METYKELFEDSYGDGSFNDEFLIDAISAEAINQKQLIYYRAKLDEIIEAVEMFKQDLKVNPVSVDFESVECVLNFVIDNTKYFF